MRDMRRPLFLSQRGTPSGMLPYLAPKRFKCTAAVYAAASGALRTPAHLYCPSSSAVTGTHGHARKRASPLTSQTGCPAHSACDARFGLVSPSPHKLPPEDPRPVGPRMESTQSEGRMLSS